MKKETTVGVGSSSQSGANTGMQPDQSGTMPPGIPYIIGNEAAERFSYYGMKGILVVFMTQYLMNNAGQLAPMDENNAVYWYHMFATANYLFPIIGALVADIFWGKYKTIMSLSVVYCLGHLALALFETRFGLAIGLTLIAIGSGGIKPCVSAHVGDQFSSRNKHLIEKVFSWFYISINVGAAISSLLTPELLKHYGPSWAFGVPGALMLIATFLFWLGRNKFTAIESAGWATYKRDAFSPSGLRILGRLSLLYVFIAVFWSLFDQIGSSWVLQAEKMDRTINLGFVKFEILASQVQSFNPVLILILVPFFTFVLYPFLGRFVRLTSLRKIGAGLVIAAMSFAVIALAEGRLQAGESVHILWQLGAYLVLTSAEVMVSVTGLEYSYTQAPNTMKSIIMGLWWLAVSIGNLIAAQVNSFIRQADGTLLLTGADYFWFFSGLMAVSALIFIAIAMRQKEQTFIQSGHDLQQSVAVEN